MKTQRVESGAAEWLSSQQYLYLLSTSEAKKKQTLSSSSLNKEDLEDSLGCSKDMSTVANRRRNMKEGLCSDKDLGDLFGNGSGKKSKRLVGCGMSSSLGNSLRLLLLLIVALSYVVAVSAKSEMIPEDDFDSSNKKVKFEDFDTNVTPVEPGGGVTSPVKCPLELEESESVNNVWHALIASFSVIVVSELGDKTFLIAAIMAMRYSRLTVFSGAIGALSLMSLLCTLFGYVTTIIPKAITYYLSTVFFAIFGLKMMYDGYRMSPHEGQKKLDEVEDTVRRCGDNKKDVESLLSNERSLANQGYKLPTGLRFILSTLFSRIFVQAFTMTFTAEWGDRSQIATVILAARNYVPGVCLGAILGHALCIGLAVLGGRVVGSRISVRSVTMIGGVLYLILAMTSIFLSPEFNMVLSDVETDSNYPYDDPDFERKLALAYDGISKCDTKMPCPFKD